MKLRADENLICKARPHWIVFAWTVWLGSLAARFFYAGNYGNNAPTPKCGLVWRGRLGCLR